MTLIRGFLCCLLLTAWSFYSFAETKTLAQWIDAFNDSGEQIFYSSDYLNATTLNQPIHIEHTNIEDLGLALKALNFSLEAVNQERTVSYVIRPIQTESVTTVLVHAFDNETGRIIPDFSATLTDHPSIHSQHQTIVLTFSTEESGAITVNAQGYYALETTVDYRSNKTQVIDVALKPLPLSLSDIRVSSSLISFNQYENSLNSLSREDLADQVAINHDTLRVAENMAGSASDGISGKTHTRGGNLNETLVLLDNRELRNPYHFKDFFSLFSTINDTVVDSVDYYSGVFPVKYGGRLSAVLDVQSNQWADLPNQEARLGLLSSSYTIRHTNPEQDRYYMMAVRTGGQFIDKHLIPDVGIRPEYDDGYFKAAQSISSNWQMSQHLLVSRDEININEDEEVAEADYHDQNLWLQWFYDDLGDHQLSIQAYASRRHDRRQGTLLDSHSQAQVKEDLFSQFQGIKFEHKWSINSHVLLDYGFDISTEETRIASLRNISHSGELTQVLGLNRTYNRQFDFEAHGVAIKSYVNARYQWQENWVMDLGLHYHNQEWVHGGALSPRLNLAYFPNDRSSWHLGLGRHQQTQHIDELLLEDTTPTYFQPASADLMVIEFNHKISDRLSLLSELYYKKYSRTHPYYENLFNGFHVLPDLFYDRVRLEPDDAQAAGLEFTLKGQHKKINWSASYVFSDVKDEFDGVYIPRSWNQGNAFNLFFSTPLKSWHLSLNAKFHNGWPRTQVISVNNISNEVAVGQRNQTTFKDFYQIDFKLDKSWRTELGLWHAEFQLSNALNTNNPCCTNYQLNDGVLTIKSKNGLPLLPNFQLGLSW